MYYDEPLSGFGIKSIGKALKKVVTAPLHPIATAKDVVKIAKKVALPVTAAVLAVPSGGSSLALLAAGGAGATAGLVGASAKKKAEKANVAMLTALTGQPVLTKAQEKIGDSGKSGGNVKYSTMSASQLADERVRLTSKIALGKDLKDLNAKLAVLDIVQKQPAKVESLSVGSSGTAVEIAVAQQTTGSGASSPAASVLDLVIPAAMPADPLVIKSTDSKKTTKEKKAAQKARASAAEARLAALQAGTTGAIAEAAALAKEAGTSQAEALKTLIEQAQKSVDAGGAPAAAPVSSGGGGGVAPSGESAPAVAESASAPAMSDNLKYGLIAGGLAAVIFFATRRK